MADLLCSCGAPLPFLYGRDERAEPRSTSGSRVLRCSLSCGGLPARLVPLIIDGMRVPDWVLALGALALVHGVPDPDAHRSDRSRTAGSPGRRQPRRRADGDARRQLRRGRFAACLHVRLLQLRFPQLSAQPARGGDALRDAGVVLVRVRRRSEHRLRHVGPVHLHGLGRPATIQRPAGHLPDARLSLSGELRQRDRRRRSRMSRHRALHPLRLSGGGLHLRRVVVVHRFRQRLSRHPPSRGHAV